MISDFERNIGYYECILLKIQLYLFIILLTLGLLKKLQKIGWVGKAKCKPFIELLVPGNVLSAGNPVISKTLCPT